MTLFEVRLTFFEVSVGILLSTKSVWLYLPFSEFGFQWSHRYQNAPYVYAEVVRLLKFHINSDRITICKSDRGEPITWYPVWVHEFRQARHSR